MTQLNKIICSTLLLLTSIFSFAGKSCATAGNFLTPLKVQAAEQTRATKRFFGAHARTLLNTQGVRLKSPDLLHLAIANPKTLQITRSFAYKAEA